MWLYTEYIHVEKNVASAVAFYEFDIKQTSIKLWFMCLFLPCIQLKVFEFVFVFFGGEDPFS